MAKQNLQRKRWWRGDVWAVTKDGIERLDGRYFVKADRLFEDYPDYSWPEHIAEKGASAYPAEFAAAWREAIEEHIGPVEFLSAERRAYVARSISKAKVLAEQAGIYASNLERYKTIRGGGKFALFCPSEGAAISDVAAMTDEALQALAAQHPIPLPNMEERAQQVAEREAQVQRWDDCEADVRAVLAGQPCPERDGEPYSQEELTIACQEISRSRDVAEAEACALAGTTPTWTKTAVVWAELQTALRKEAVPEAKSKDQDDGGPVTINVEALDDAKVPGGWTSYGKELPETPPAAMIIPRWAEKHIVTYHEGAGGVGKSYIAQQEAACIAAGRNPMNCGQPIEQCDVFYLNYEEPQAEFERRLYRIENNFGRANPFDTSRLHARHLRDHAGGHLLRVTHKGEIILTRFGREFLDMLEERASRKQHSYVVFDGLMDAILFEGGSRSDDSIARQVIALLDRWCVSYNFTGRAIIHPSRAGEREGGGSYAPAWTTKPRAIQTYKRVTLDGRPVTDHVPADHIFTQRMIAKCSHGETGHRVEMQYRNGIWRSFDGEGGAEDPVSAATDLAIRYAQRDMPIKRNGDIGKDCGRVSNTHAIITEYRRRTGAKHGRDHFMAALAEAERCGHLTYRAGRSKTAAGYVEAEIPF